MADSSNAAEERIRATVKDATDPLEQARKVIDRITRCVKSDAGAPFEPNAIEAAALLKERDVGAFSRYRRGLRKGGVSLRLLDRELHDAASVTPTAAAKPSQADLLVQLVRDRTALFRDADNAHVVITAPHETGEHKEVWPLRSRGFRAWVGRAFFEDTQKAPNSEAISAALNVLEGQARFKSAAHKVSLRIAERGGKIYLDLADEKWRAVEIDMDGWRIINDPIEHDVYFRRPRGMSVLSEPIPGGSAHLLRKFVNIENDRDFILIVAWLVGAFRPCGPYPVLVLHGEHGAAKTTGAEYLRAIIDPNLSPLRAEPKEPRDLMIGANNAWICAFDNLSHLPPWMSDSLCRLATGGGFSTRELYTDGEETIFDAQRPIILTGIEELATRSDLLDRSIVRCLPPIREDQRRRKKVLDQEFEQARPAILGALLDAVSAALRNSDKITLPALPSVVSLNKV